MNTPVQRAMRATAILILSAIGSALAIGTAVVSVVVPAAFA